MSLSRLKRHAIIKSKSTGKQEAHRHKSKLADDVILFAKNKRG